MLKTQFALWMAQESVELASESKWVQDEHGGMKDAVEVEAEVVVKEETIAVEEDVTGLQ